MKFVHFSEVVVCFHDAVDLFGGGHDVGKRGVMVHKVDQGSNKFAHIGFYEIRSGLDFGGQISEICSNDLIEVPMLISSIEVLQPIGEQAESTTDINSSCIHGF